MTTIINEYNSTNITKVQTSQIQKFIINITVWENVINTISSVTAGTVKKALKTLDAHKVYISNCTMNTDNEIEYISNILKENKVKLSDNYQNYGDFIDTIVNRMVEFVKILYDSSYNNKTDINEFCIYKLLSLLSNKNSGVNPVDVIQALQDKTEKLKKVYSFFTEDKDVEKLFEILNDKGDKSMVKKQKNENTTIAVKNKHFETAQDAYDNMLKSGKLGETLRKCTIERYTEADLSRVHEDRRNGYNRIDLTHNNGIPISIFVYYKEKLIFHIEAYDDFGSMVSDDITLNLSRGKVDTFLKNVCRAINSLAGKAEKGNVLNEEN